MISDLGNGHTRKRPIRRRSPVSGIRNPVSSRVRPRVEDEFTNRDDLSPRQKWERRNPYVKLEKNPGRSFERVERTNLGLALVSLVAIPGVPLTAEDIAAWCDCSTQAIQQIERVALKKLRIALFFRDHALWDELRAHLDLFAARQPARSRNTRHPSSSLAA